MKRDEQTHGDRPVHFLIWVVVSLAGAQACNWVSNLTGGDEYGGRFDLPALNTVTWIMFLLLTAAAILGVFAGLLHVVERLVLRIRTRS